MTAPARFNFTRDVVEQADGAALALRFVDTGGGVRDLTFAEVAESAARWAGLLRSRGVQPGDRVLVLVGKTPDWHAVMLAGLKAGAVTIPCSEMLRAKDLDFRVRHSGARLLLADERCRKEVEAMSEPCDVVYLEEAVLGEPDGTTADTAADDPAFILYTSGTTKDPKGVVHTHRYTWAKRAQAERWLDARPGEVVWCTAGTGWAKSIWNVLLGPWSCGSAVILHEGGFEPEERFRLLEELAPDVLCQAPTEYRLMAKIEGISRYDLSRTRHLVSAGEPLNPEVIRAFESAFGRTIHDGYGQTENTLLVGNFPGTEIRPGSMGKPAPGYDVRVIDFDGNETAAGEEGDIALRGDAPALFAGYWNQPDETAAVYRGDWYVTGDRAVRDEDGYLWFIGPRGRRDPLGRLPDRPVRGRERAARACRGRGERGRREARPGSRPDREGVRGATARPPGGRRARLGAAVAREARDRPVQVPARDRVRRLAPEDAEREDQARRAAQARGGARSGLGGFLRLLGFPGKPLFFDAAVQTGDQVAGPLLHALVPLIGLVSAVQFANPGRISLLPLRHRRPPPARPESRQRARECLRAWC